MGKKLTGQQKTILQNATLKPMPAYKLAGYDLFLTVQARGSCLWSLVRHGYLEAHPDFYGGRMEQCYIITPAGAEAIGRADLFTDTEHAVALERGAASGEISVGDYVRYVGTDEGMSLAPGMAGVVKEIEGAGVDRVMRVEFTPRVNFWILHELLQPLSIEQRDDLAARLARAEAALDEIIRLPGDDFLAAWSIAVAARRELAIIDDALPGGQDATGE